MTSVLGQHKKMLFAWGIIVAIVAVGISAFFPIQYSATSQVLIISHTQTGVDPYTQAKAAEQIGANLAAVMGTTDFFNLVMNNPAVSFDKTMWQALSDRDQRKDWQRDVKPSVVYDTSLLSITAYASGPAEAVNLSEATAETLVTDGWQYIGENIDLKEVDKPIASRFPTRPDFLVNGLAGFVVGVLAAGVWLTYYMKKR